MGLTRRGRRRLLVVGAAAGLGAGAPLWAPPVLGLLPTFRIERVQISGATFVSPDEVLRLAAIEPNASVWSDGTAWEQRVRTHPLVREARVRRVGMREVEIRVTEVEPLALVPDVTLVPVGPRGRALPLDPAATRLNLPVLTGGQWLENGFVTDPRALASLRALAALREYDAAFFGQISEIRPLGAESVLIELVESGRTGRLLLRASEAVQGLHRVELALGHASDSTVATADARFEGQVVLRTRERG